MRGKKRKPFLASFIGTLSDLAFVWAGSGVGPCLPVLFFCLDFLRSRHLRLRRHLLDYHFQRGDEADFGALGILC